MDGDFPRLYVLLVTALPRPVFDEAGGEPCPVSGPRYSACGRKDGGGGLLESPESLQPQLG